MAKKREARFIISAENKTAATISKVTGDVSKLGGAFQKVGKLVGPVFAGLASAAAVRSFANMVKGANDTVDAMGEVAGRLGIATSKLQEYRIAAKFAGVESEGLDKALGFLARNLGNIRNGLDTGGKKSGLLESLGLSSSEIRGGDVSEVFEKVVNGLSKIEDPATRSATAIALFGKSAGELGLLFKDGVPALERSRDLIRDLGLEIDDIDAARAGQLNDNFDKLNLILESAKNKIAAELSPTVIALTDRMLEAGSQGETMGQQIETGVSEALDTISRLYTLTSTVGNVFSATFNLIQAGFAGLAAVVTGFAAEFVKAIGTTAPNAFNALLVATEVGLTAMKQGFADFATGAANLIVASMNTAIAAVEKLVNVAANGLNNLIVASNAIAGTSFSTIGTASLGRVESFQNFPVDPVNFGRVDPFGGDLATGLGDYSKGFGNEGNRQLNDAAVDFRQAVLGVDDLLSGDVLPPKPIEDTAAALDLATDSANGLTDALGGGSGGGSGGSSGSKGGGTAGAVKKLGEATKEAGETMRETFKILEEYGKAVTSSLEKGIDDFVRSGKFSVSEFGASLLRDLAAITAKAAILGGILGNSQYGGNGSGLVGSFLSGLFSGGTGTGAASYDGGGFTGFGSRSGGLDGKGGFAAILHPNETVVDHTRGQSSGGPVTVNQTVVVRETMPAGVANAITRAASQQAVAEMLSISQRGGQRRKSFAFG
jgi:hypothetical protein